MWDCERLSHCSVPRAAPGTDGPAPAGLRRMCSAESVRLLLGLSSFSNLIGNLFQMYYHEHCCQSIQISEEGEKRSLLPVWLQSPAAHRLRILPPGQAMKGDEVQDSGTLHIRAGWQTNCPNCISGSKITRQCLQKRKHCCKHCLGCHGYSSWCLTHACRVLIKRLNYGKRPTLSVSGSDWLCCHGNQPDIDQCFDVTSRYFRPRQKQFQDPDLSSVIDCFVLPSVPAVVTHHIYYLYIVFPVTEHQSLDVRDVRDVIIQSFFMAVVWSI